MAAAGAERLHCALDRYEQDGDASELDALMLDGTGSGGAFGLRLRFTDGGLGGAPISLDAPRGLSDEADEDFSPFEARGLPTPASSATALTQASSSGARCSTAEHASELLFSLSARRTDDMDLAGHSRAEGLFGGRHRRGAGNADYHGADLARDLDEDAAYDESYDGPGARRRRDAADDVQGLEARGARRGFVGVYSPAARRKRVETFLEKRSRRVWTRKVKYDVRKSFADTRMRVKGAYKRRRTATPLGRFVKKEDEDLLKELLRVV